MMKPNSRPQATMKQIQDIVLSHRVVDPLVVVGIRGYYKDSMGKPGVNDRGIYDDAIFLVAHMHFSSYNANTDPSGYRKGWGTGASKGMASLKEGLYRAHKLDIHNGKYLALCQRAGKVTVIRDGNPPYEDVGNFGINIHRGGDGTTSSLGCQTIVPEQWEGFIANVRNILKDNHDIVVPYILVDNA